MLTDIDFKIPRRDRIGCEKRTEAADGIILRIRGVIESPGVKRMVGTLNLLSGLGKKLVFPPPDYHDLSRRSQGLRKSIRKWVYPMGKEEILASKPSIIFCAAS